MLKDCRNPTCPNKIPMTREYCGLACSRAAYKHQSGHIFHLNRSKNAAILRGYKRGEN